MPATALELAFSELSLSPPARRVFVSTNVIAISLRTLAREWERSEYPALRSRVPGLLQSAEKFESEAAAAMREVAAS